MWPWVIAAIQLLGILSAIRAVMDARTPQGAIAWAIALIAFPYLALPLFWIFGKRKFVGYVIERRSALSEASLVAQKAFQANNRIGDTGRTEYPPPFVPVAIPELPEKSGLGPVPSHPQSGVPPCLTPNLP